MLIDFDKIIVNIYALRKIYRSSIKYFEIYKKN